MTRKEAEEEIAKLIQLTEYAYTKAKKLADDHNVSFYINPHESHESGFKYIPARPPAGIEDGFAYDREYNDFKHGVPEGLGFWLSSTERC